MPAPMRSEEEERASEMTDGSAEGSMLLLAEAEELAAIERGASELLFVLSEASPGELKRRRRTKKRACRIDRCRRSPLAAVLP